MTRTLGLLGGMSWESTLVYYRLINQGVAARRGGLASAPLRLASLDFAEVAALQRAADWDGAAALLGQAGAGLRAAGAQALVIATNTMHKVAEAVGAASGLPLLHIGDATGRAAQRAGCRHLGLLGTRFTMEDRFLADHLARHFDLRCSVPDADERAEMHRIIFDELCRGQCRDSSRQAVARMMDGLAARGCDAVVLGCTEISLLINPRDTGWPVPLIDTTAEHAQAAVDWLLETPPMKADAPTPWTLAARAARMNPSIIREILKLTEQPGVLSLAGGLPSPDSFPIEAMRDAANKVLTDSPREALQYAASEGYAPLREWVAAHMNAQGLRVTAGQVLITTGSQQGLDLVGKVLVDSGAPVAVEAPTYLGALQAFSPYEPIFASVAGDGDGPLPEAIARLPHDAPGTRFMYVLPNFQNPTGRVIPEARRQALIAAAQAARLPLVEDNPYGDLWFDAPPPAPLAARWAEGTIYLGSFSKVLAPGLRLGYVIAPPALYPKLLQAKQAADLHTPSFNQRLVHEVIKDGFLDQHVPRIRARYAAQRDAMATALAEHLPAGSEWSAPQGGMFFWVRLPAGCHALALLPQAVAAGVAYVPGEAFFAHQPDPRTVRLSFVTLQPDEIRTAVGILGGVLRQHLNEGLAAPAP